MNPVTGETRAVVGLLRRWTRRAGIGWADQALVSGSNFVVAVLAGRWLGASEYGAFGIAMSIYIVAFGLHMALVQEPLSVFGSAPGPRGVSFVRASLPYHLLLSAVAGVVMLVSALLLRGGALGPPLLGLALATPTLLHYSYLRRTGYVRACYTAVVRAAVAYAGVQLLVLILLRSTGSLGPATVFVPMAIASILASIALGSALRRAGMEGDVQATLTWKDAARESVRFGKWGVGTSLTYFGSTALYGPLLGLVVGLGAAGIYKAHTNLAMPLSQSVVAVSLVVLPHLSRRGAEAGYEYLGPVIRRMMLLAGLVGGAYVLALVFGARPLTELLYANSQYTEYSALAVILAAAQAVGAVRQGLYLGTKAMLQPQLVFWGQAVGAGMSLSLGVFLVLRYGIIGAGAGQLVSNIGETLWLDWAVRRRLRSAPSGD